MIKKKLLLVHLSDVHIRFSTDSILTRASHIAATIYKHLPSVDNVMLLLSGDIAWSGKSDEYDLAKNFINQIVQSIKSQCTDQKIDIVVCPGNHDCDFSLENETREAVLARIRNLDGQVPSTSLVETATSIQSEFFSFAKSTSTLDWEWSSKLSWQCATPVGGVPIGIRCLNVAWMSELKEKQGALVFPPEVITPFKFDKQQGISITLLHHPFNWFSQSTYRIFQSAVRHQSHLIFTGHEHFQNVGEVSDIRTSPSVYIEGGVLFERESPNLSNFNLVLVDLHDEQYLTEFYSWTGELYISADETESWASLRALPVKGSPRYSLNPDFMRSLKDPGANFSHTGKKHLTIDDVFVWPELLCVDDPAVVKKQINASHLEDMANVGAGAFVRGDEKAGKSTLLRQYFSSYFDRGFLPLYFRGSWFTQVHQRDPLRALKYALDRQYTRTGHQAWLQESKDKRVLLLDDLDLSSQKGESLSKALKGLFEHFGTVIVAATDDTEAVDILSMDRVEALHPLTKYEIREFGHKKRFELVCKWAAIGGESEGTAAWMATIDKWEKDLTAAVGRQFVPAVPIFLLTLLQSIESGRTADLQNSAFGHYYQFLVTSALEQIGVDKKQWNEVFNYCANLSWFSHSLGERHLSEKQLLSFNEAYSKEFTPVSFEKRLKDLLSAGIISRTEEVYEFKYPYLYFFFLGQYFADNIHEEHAQQVVIRLCDDLHLRDNANILLFTSHHTKSPFIYERIAEALDKCFEADPPFDFEKDVHVLNSLVDSAPQLVFEDISTKESRSRARQAQDNSEREEEEFSDPTADSAAAVTRLFRGIEILGQFLKNHYGTTKNPIKEQLITKLIDSSLRGLQNVTAVLLRDKEALSDHVVRLLSEKRPDLSKEERGTLAKRFVFDVVGMISFGFVLKAGTAVGSEYLRQNLDTVVDSNGGLAYRLVAMSYQMDLPENLPLHKIKLLNKSLEKNVFARALLSSMALRHLHLFKVAYKDKQRLCEELDIGLTKPPVLPHDRKANKTLT